MDGSNDNQMQAAQAQMMQEMLMEVAQVQEQLMEFTNQCFNRCVDSIDDTLSSRQETCLNNCSAALVQSSSFLADRLTAQSEAQQQGHQH